MAQRIFPQVLAGIAALAVIHEPALAHPGSHAGLGLEAIAEHFATPYHMVPLAVVAIAGLGLAMLRRRRVQRQSNAAGRGKDRP